MILPQAQVKMWEAEKGEKSEERWKQAGGNFGVMEPFLYASPNKRTDVGRGQPDIF
jgi:hypothetical protein